MAIAEKIQCQECLEGRLKPPDNQVSLDREEHLWRTLQMDAFYFRRHHTVHHFLLFLDEASSFAVVAELVVHSDEFSANIDTESVIDALERCGIQYFGWPQVIKCDLEGAFRGNSLANFCEERGIDLRPVLAEHHQGIAEVERSIGELQRKMELFLREARENSTPRQAAYSMVAAHNAMMNVGGYSPSQWALGRNFEEPVNLPYLTSQGADGKMAHNLEIRMLAQQSFVTQQARSKLSRAANTKSKEVQKFVPGDVIYYRRFKVPADRPANALVDVPRLRT